MSKPRIGVLAIQGDFKEHLNMLEESGAQAQEIRYLEQLDLLDGLVIPGGESTTLNKFDSASRGELFETLRRLGREGMPIYGTCMGTIMLAGRIEGSGQGTLGLMNIEVRRNAYGPQRKSFEVDIEIPCLGTLPYSAVFIRAPQIVSVGPEVETLAEFDGSVIMARMDNFLVTTFHPEITDDIRVHQYFVNRLVAPRDNETGSLRNKTNSRAYKTSLRGDVSTPSKTADFDAYSLSIRQAQAP